MKSWWNRGKGTSLIERDRSNESLKEQAKAFAVQQDSLFGDILMPRGAARRQGSQQERQPQPASGDDSALTERLVSITEPWVNAPSLESLNQMICTCQKCPLGQSRTRFVFGTGNFNADIVVIGEAPGADEDASGEPFVGLAGQLLTKILAAIKLKRDDVFICNILKCRPPGNRKPEPFEVEQCEPYLLKQLDLIRPKFILALGLTAANTLLNKRAKMSELRGTVHDYHGIRVVVTYHPAALLRNQQWKRPAWEDVQRLRRLYDEEQAAAS
ncbi:MAG: uracil-DNA glycosylase [Candidatus Kapaibacterium sp.]